MSPIIVYSLILHVMLSVIGMIASYVIVMFLLQRTLKLLSLKIASIIGFISYLLSLLSGLYFMGQYYFPVLSKKIEGGMYPWAESFVYIKGGLLIFVTLSTLFIVLKIVRKQEMLVAGSARQSFLIKISSFTLASSILMVLVGVIISGISK